MSVRPVWCAVTWGPVALALLLGAADVVQEDYRAVTLGPGERATFRVPGLERVTGASGRCVEEGMDTAEPETFFLEASCAGLRTTMAWRRDGRRVHVMACAEPEERTEAQVKLRKALQVQLKGLRSVTACVRDGRVELWGWVKTASERKRVAALEAKHGRDQVRDRVELLKAED